MVRGSKYDPSTERKQTKESMTHVHTAMEVRKNASRNYRQVHTEESQFHMNFKVSKVN